jgi:hypothetical protein
MKLIIDISEELKQKIDEGLTNQVIINKLWDATRNGTPLPKGHGRILDEKDILDTKNNDGGWYDLVDMPEYIAGVKAIIEADTESEEQA